MGKQQAFTLAAGTVCHRNGIPFKLQQPTRIECHPGVWPLIKGEPPEAQGDEVVKPVHPLAPAGAAELVPLLTRLVECGAPVRLSSSTKTLKSPSPMGAERKKLADLQRQMKQGQEVFNVLQRSGYGLTHSADFALQAGGSPQGSVEPSLQMHPLQSCSARKGWMDPDVLKPGSCTKRSKPEFALAVAVALLFALASFSLAVRTRQC